MKRGTLLKVRHDGTALLIHSFSSHIFSQGMVCAIAATVSAGMAGQGTLVKSGWEQSTEEKRTLVLKTNAWLPGATRRTTDGHNQAGKTPQPENHKRREKREAKTKHGRNSAYLLQCSFFYCTGYK